MAKLFATDLDGTFLKDHRFDEYTLETIRLIIESGNYFAISTGRPMHKKQILDMGLQGLDIYFIISNGAMIRNKDLDVIWKKEMPLDTLEGIIDNFADCPLEYISENKTYATLGKEEMLQHHKVAFPRDNTAEKCEEYISNISLSCSKEEILKANIIKVNGMFVEITDERLVRIRKFCEKQDNIIDAPSHQAWCEISDKFATKGHAVKNLANILNIKDEDIYVFGDASNDLPMLMMFDNAYVPSNGSDEAKKYAKEVLGHNNDYSVSNKMRAVIKGE